MDQRHNRGETDALFITVLIVLGLIISVTLYIFTQQSTSNETLHLQEEAVTLGSTINILPLLNQGTYTITYTTEPTFSYCINTATCTRKVFVQGTTAQRSYTFSDSNQQPLIFDHEKTITITNKA